MKIYTKRGDFGKTDLCNGSRVSKNSVRIKALGLIDETSSALGFASSFIKSKELNGLIELVQTDLYFAQSEIACFEKAKKISGKNVSVLEKKIDELELKLTPLKHFILPSGSTGASALHFARTICRKTEIQLWELNEIEKINSEILKYFNRLSDLLFVMARFENKKCNSTEKELKK